MQPSGNNDDGFIHRRHKKRWKKETDGADVESWKEPVNIYQAISVEVEQRVNAPLIDLHKIAISSLRLSASEINAELFNRWYAIYKIIISTRKIV